MRRLQKEPDLEHLRAVTSSNMSACMLKCNLKCRQQDSEVVFWRFFSVQAQNRSEFGQLEVYMLEPAGHGSE